MLKELQERRVLRVISGYVVVCFVCLQIADVTFEPLAIDQSILRIVIAVMLLALPIVGYAAWVFDVGPDNAIQRTASQSPLLEVLVFVVALSLFGFGSWMILRAPMPVASTEAQSPKRLIEPDGATLNSNIEDKKLNQEKIRQIRSDIAEDRYAEAFLALRAITDFDDFAVEDLWEKILSPGIPATNELGVSISIKPYGYNTEWITIGSTPFGERAKIPKGVVELRFQKEGLVPLEVAAVNPGPMFGNVGEHHKQAIANRPHWVMHQPQQVQQDMVYVPSSGLEIASTGFPSVKPILNSPPFWIGRLEVTNEEYKAFVDEGGYSDPRYWSALLSEIGAGDDSLSSLLEEFVDTTGRPGPSTWSFGSYAVGTSEMPVGGVSWYEASAYAAYRGAELPSIHHWTRAAFAPVEHMYPLNAAISSTSNFDSGAPVPVSQRGGLGPWGTHHTAGNAREWVSNTIFGNESQGILAGGSWKAYGDYHSVETISRRDRREDNGIRLMRSTGEADLSAALHGPVSLPYDASLVQREPVSDDAFALMEAQFTLPQRAPLESNVKRVLETDLYEVEEHILRYAGGETLTIYFFLPLGASAPIQTVLYTPPADALQSAQNINALKKVRNFDYLLQSGRAIVFPIWEGTYNRALPPPENSAEAAEQQRKLVLAWERDAAETINYLLALDRSFQPETLSLFGVSFGAGWMGPVLLAMEPRIKSAILLAGGVVNEYALHPMIDMVNYIPRVQQPVLMLNGSFDHYYPLETSAKRFYNLLGTPANQKKMVIFDGGHIDWPRNRKVRAVVDWLDQIAASPPT